MAYLSELEDKCANPRCDKSAVVQLYSNRNEDMGTFCRSCGNRRLKELLKEEGK